MKFRWRGGNIGFLARSTSRALRRGVRGRNRTAQAVNSCALLVILIMGVPLALFLLLMLLFAIEQFFVLLQNEPLLAAILFGSIIIGILALIYIQRKRYIQSVGRWLLLKFKEIIRSISQISKGKIVILASLTILAIIFCAALFIIAVITFAS
jgi:hypothetical protein